jgi:hypothetical protein
MKHFIRSAVAMAFGLVILGSAEAQGRRGIPFRGRKPGPAPVPPRRTPPRRTPPGHWTPGKDRTRHPWSDHRRGPFPRPKDGHKDPSKKDRSSHRDHHNRHSRKDARHRSRGHWVYSYGGFYQFGQTPGTTLTTGGYPTGGYPTGGGYPVGGGSYATGEYPGEAGEVIASLGKLEKDLETKNILREKARQERINTRRKLFDEILYERAHTPTFVEREEQREALNLRRSQTTAPDTEVWSGKALNHLLKDAVALQGRMVFGPRIELDPEVLQQINVTAHRHGTVAVLRNGGRLEWPVGLEELTPAARAGRIRERLERAARSAVREARWGKVGRGILKDLRLETQSLRRLLAANVDRLETTDYVDAKRFLNDLDEAIRTLARPDAENYFNRTWAAKGKTVKDLVAYMKRKGLLFAPAQPGDEAAYQALHRALAAYDLAAREYYSVRR